MESSDEKYMKMALQLAKEASDRNEVPVGAIDDFEEQVVASTHNLKEQTLVATHHAEILAIEAASRKLGRWRLSDCTLYVTLEPCSMCAGAIVQSRIGRVVVGTKDPKAGACGSVLDITGESKLNHQPEMSFGVLAEECSQILKDFFKSRR